jgi:hypothetical protein
MLGIATCIVAFLTIGLAIPAAIIITDADNLSYQDYSYIEQIADDWTTVPLVDLKVQSTACETGWINVFEAQWLGTLEGCLVAQPGQTTQIMTLATYNSLFGDDMTNCQTLDAIAGINTVNTFN